MPEPIVYLDYNATAPPLPEVIEAMVEISKHHFGNPSSPHRAGREAKAVLENDRKTIAEILDLPKEDLVFTSGGSESNNTVLRQLLLKGTPQHLIVSQIEHPSILNTCHFLEQTSNIQVSYLPVDSRGIVEPDTLRAEIRSETSLISIMTANNETGVLQPISDLASIALEHEIPFHTDSVQALGKVPVHWNIPGVCYATITAHKIGGPKGIGLLYVKQGTQLEPLISGGKQERVYRAGTESVMLSHGFAKALQWNMAHFEEMQTAWGSFRSQILSRIQSMEGFFLNGLGAPILANTFNFGFEGLSAESLLIALDLEGIAVSTGSACSSGALEASHVLLAMGYSKKKSKSCLRVSMGWRTSQNDIDVFLERLHFHVKRLYEKKRCKTN